MAKTVNRLALQQSLVRNGIADDPAAGNVADDWGDEIDEVTSDLATKEDLEVFGRELIATVNLRFAEMQADLERRDKERAERESEWWRLQQERDDKWRAEQRERDEAREKRDEEWRREQQKREDDRRAEQQKRDEAREKRDEEWRKEQQKREDDRRTEQRKRDEAREKRDEEWRKEQRERDEAREKRDEKWHAEQRERDEAQRKRDQEAAKTTSKILWALFGSAGLIGTVVGIVVAVT